MTTAHHTKPLADPRVVRAAIYLRISSDPEGLELGTTRQREDCLAHVERRGYVLTTVYTDNDRSASAYARRVRPEFQQMIADARAGNFDVIVAYTDSRVTRQIEENEVLIRLALDHGITFDYLRSPSFDLNTADGREMARNAAVRNTAEVERTSERVTRDVRRRAEKGAFHGGGVPFGFDPVWGLVNRQEKVIRFTVNAEHASWLKDAAARVLAGETTYSIIKDWNEAGRRTQRGLLWTQKALTRILVNPASAGLRKYNDEVYAAPWEAILDEQTHERLVTVLTDPARKGSTENRRKYMMSGLLFCGRCGNMMSSTSPKSSTNGYQAGYECSKMKTGHPGCGRMRVVMETVDRYITTAVFHALEESEAFAKADTTADVSADELAAREEVRKWELSLANLIEERDAGLIPDLAEYTGRRTRITDRLEAARQALARTTHATVRTSLPPVDQLREQWKTRDAVWRRVVVSAVIERVDVHPHPRGVSSAPPRRRGEPETEWRTRFDIARMETMARRLDIHWAA